MTSIKEYQDTQSNLLYRNGEYHKSHDMFIDIDDGWRGCLACKTGDWTKDGYKVLVKPCEATVEDMVAADLGDKRLKGVVAKWPQPEPILKLVK